MRMTVQQWLNASDAYNFLNAYSQTGDIVIGLVTFDEQSQMFRIHVGGEYGGTYNMEADRILSGTACFDFLWQVHSKPWVTAQHLKDLMDCITCWVHREHGKFPQLFFDVAGGMERGLDEP